MSQPPLTHVILGDGVAGMSAARVIRSKRPSDRILIVSNDPQPYYYRAALTNYLMGELSDGELWAMPADYWQKLRFERVFGEAAALDAQQRQVRLTGGETLKYDRLLIATGARALRLKTPQEDPERGVPGANFPGVTVMRTLADTRQLIDAAARSKHALVLGGGILGLEVCHGLKARNVKISLVHRGKWLMERVVNRRAAELIQLRMLRDGIDMHMNCGIEKIHGSTRGISAVDLTDRSRVQCPLVVTSIGIVPNTEWLRNSSIKLERGHVPVDRSMRVANLPEVWAAGDVVHFQEPDLPFANPGGLWQPAGKQGQIAGLAMVEDSPYALPEYRPGVIYNATRAWDLDLGTLGDHVDGEGEVVSHESRDNDKPIYKRVLIRDGHVVGALLLGDRREGHALRHLMNLKGVAGDVSAIKDHLLAPDFDLPAWVASRANQSGSDRWKKTVLLPAGSLPPSIAAAAGKTTQLQIAIPTPAETMLARAVGTVPLTIRTRGDAKTFTTRRVRVGRDPKCEIRLEDLSIGNEEIQLSLEGNVWVAFTTKTRNSQSGFNGNPLTKPEVLRDSDFLSLGAWTGVVELSAEKNDQDRQECAVLRGDKPYYVDRKFTMLGSGPDNDLVFDVPGVASIHAQIHRHGSPAEFYAMDAGSTSGTFVNGNRVFAPVLLRPKDVLQLGSLQLMFEGTVAAAAPAPVPVKSAPAKSAGITLLATEGPLAGRSFSIPLPGVVGRSSNAHVVIDDPLLSARHAGFSEQEGRLFVTDLRSTNGVTLAGQIIPPGTPQPLPDGASLRLGRNLFVASRAPQVNAKRQREVAEFMLPDNVARLDCRTNSWSTNFSLAAEITTVGRDPQCDLVIPEETVSRKHLRLRKAGGVYQVVDLESSSGTIVNGRRLAAQETATLKDGDEIKAGNCVLVYRAPLNQTASTKPESPSPRSEKSLPAFRIDWSPLGDPLARDLRKVVQEELDACIGCHDCMRACPLPDASQVSIGALNSYAAGLSVASTTALRFIEQCTQCQACVPVCPVNIQRSRIVLWNKLKHSPDAEHRPQLQVGNDVVEANWTIGNVAERLAEHRVLGALNGPERLSLLGNARFRRLFPGERLLEQGVYTDAMWFVLEGRLELGMATTKSALQRMVLLTAGQSVGEISLLSDQPSDLTAAAVEPTTVLGLPKYVIKARMQQSPAFRRAIEALYVSRSLEVFVQKLPSLAGASDELLGALLGEFEAERYLPGKPILSAEDSLTTFALVRRGFVSEIRSVDGVNVVANYLKEGEAFGTTNAARRGELVRYEAATLVEVFTVHVDRLRALEKRFPGLRRRLIGNDAAVAGAPTGRTEMFQKAACEGVLQASQLMVIDTRMCVDCDNCVTACERRHGTSRLDRSNAGLQIGHYQVPASCYHCNDPVCLLCAVDGIVREPSGEIRIISDNCIGCGACAERCPYDNIQMVQRDGRQRPLLQRILPKPIFEMLGIFGSAKPAEDYERVAVKCDLCAGFANGPACVRSCPTGAAQRANPLELFRR